MTRFARSPARWRPCCGACRSERLLRILDPRPAASDRAHCEDCGAGWDGSSLSQAEAADRPPAPPGRAQQFFAEA
jgi:hypothetical protein